MSERKKACDKLASGFCEECPCDDYLDILAWVDGYAAGVAFKYAEDGPPPRPEDDYE